MRDKVGVSRSKATRHFWHQRLTALTLLPLSFWLLQFLHKVLNAPYAETLAWLTSPVNAAVTAAWLLAACYHAALGVQVVLEDYVSGLGLRRVGLLINRLFFLALGLGVLFAFILLFAR